MENEPICPEYNGDYLISQSTLHRPQVITQKTVVYTLEDYQKTMDYVLPFIHTLYGEDLSLHQHVDISIHMSRYGQFDYFVGNSNFIHSNPGKFNYTFIVYNKISKIANEFSSFNRKEFYDVVSAFLFFIQKYSKQQGHIFKFDAHHIMQQDDGQREVNERITAYEEFEKIKGNDHIDYIKRYVQMYFKPELKNPFLDSPF